MTPLSDVILASFPATATDLDCAAGPGVPAEVHAGLCGSWFMSFFINRAGHIGRGMFLVLAMLMLSGCGAMKSVSKALGHKAVFTEIFIEASPEEVWAVITDAASYGDWNSVIIEAKGTYGPGAKIENLVVENDGSEAWIKSRVELFDPPRHLNQFGGYLGVITFDHHYILEPVEGGTRVIQREDYTGLYVHFWDAEWLNDGYSNVNEGLRAEVLRRKAASGG